MAAAGKELSLMIKIGGKIDKTLGSAIANAESQLQSIGKGIDKAMTATIAGVAGAGVALAKSSVDTYAKYETAITNASATAGFEKGTAEFEALDAAAQEAGRTTVKTAAESANALEYMALAGWSVEESTQALMPVLKLSAATNMELATASDLVTDSMSAYGLTVDQLPRYLDVLTSANNTANYSAQELLESYIDSAGMFRTLNVGMEDSAALMGVLANRGIKASKAGTAMNAILINLMGISPKSQATKALDKLGMSLFDTEGKTRNLLEVFQEIYDLTSDMTEEERDIIYGQLGGKSHVDAFTNLMMGFRDEKNGMKEAYALAEEFRNAGGSLEKMYKIKTDTFEGSKYTLESAFEGMQISIGKGIAPYIREIADTLTDKIPEIQEVVINAFDKITPVIANGFSYIVENSDKIIDTVIKVTAAFAGIKIGMGVIKGLNSILSLIKNISVISKAVGLFGRFDMIKGFIGSLTGLSGAALPIAGVATALVGLGAAAVGVKKAYDQFDKVNYARGMNEQAAALGETVGKLEKVNRLIKEIRDLELIINNPYSSREQIDEAKARIEEIAALVAKEYNLTVNADTSSIDTALEKVKHLTRIDLIEQGDKFLSQARNNASAHAKNKAALPELEADRKNALNTANAYGNYVEKWNEIQAQYTAGNIDRNQWIQGLNEVYSEMTENGMRLPGIGNEITPENAEGFRTQLEVQKSHAMGDYNRANQKYNTTKANADDYTGSTGNAYASYIQALASDLSVNDTLGVNTDLKKLESLGKTLKKAEESTDELSMNTALALNGFEDIAAAVEANSSYDTNALNAVAQNFMEFKKSIGDTAESAAAGAALIMNGFDNAGDAAAKGSGAINNVLANMHAIGSEKGLFAGMGDNEALAKITEMANAIGLIPENMKIVINAEGNFEAVTQKLSEIGENKIDVTIGANGDIEILDRANQITGTLQGLDAVALQVNAEGNIEVLDKAGKVIAQIDEKNAQVTVNGEVTKFEELQKAAETSEKIDGMGNVDTTQTVTGIFDGQEDINAALEKQDKIHKVDELQAVNGMFPGREQIDAALGSQAKLAPVDVKQTATGEFPGIEKIQMAYFFQQKLKPETRAKFIIEYEQKGKAPDHNAAGTSYFKGGLTYLNDQNISDPREIVEYGGKRWFYEGRDILANIPRGARIYNAAESRGAIAEAEAIINGSHKNGLDYVPFDGYIAELHKGERVLTDEEAQEYDEHGLIAQATKSLMSSGGTVKNEDNSDNSSSKFVFSPTYYIYGNADEKMLENRDKKLMKEFEEFLKKRERDKKRKSFA